MKRGILISALWASVAFTGGAAAAGSATRAIAGNTLHGFEDDGEFYDYYAKDGSAISMQVSGDTTHGTYTIARNQLCLNYPGDAPTCYTVSGAPPGLVLTESGGAKSFPVQVLKGNPKNLQ